ncbi:reverse transcriptase domain-containing protein [Tanacetum coccineum]
MPFGLRNAEATYHRLVDKAFHKQIGRNLKVYMDDLVIKSRTEDEIVRDIEETFKNLKEINMKLNPKKCTFGVKEGTFLGYTVNTKGLKVCLDKVDVVLSLPSPKCLKDVQKLNGKLASLNSQPHNTAGRYQVRSNRGLQKWSIELGEYAIHYRPKVSVKGQILADFIVKRSEEDSPDTLMEVEEELPEPWILFMDGSSCTDGSEQGLTTPKPEGLDFTYAQRFSLTPTKTRSRRTKALISGLRITEQMVVKNLHVNVDSRLVDNQVNGTQVPRSENKKADALSKIASTSFAHLSKQVLVEELKEKSIGEVEILAVVEEEGDTWMTPIFEYLTEETLPADVKKARAVRRKSQRFAIINGTLYKKSFLGPWLRCVGPLQANYVLREIHEGSCSMHAGTRSVMAKALRIGYYWPTMHKDARFGLLGEIISDNETIQGHPSKMELELDGKSSPNDLGPQPHMIKSSNEDTPFSLTYGMEAVILAEIGMPTLRTAEVDLVQNNKALEINRDLLEERREQAAIREAKSKAKMDKIL